MHEDSPVRTGRSAYGHLVLRFKEDEQTQIELDLDEYGLSLRNMLSTLTD